jgi:hypothetical protein
VRSRVCVASSHPYDCEPGSLGLPAQQHRALMEQLRAVQRRQASRARHQQHSSDQRSQWLASYGHPGAGRVDHCAAAQAISPVTEASYEQQAGAGRRDLRCCSARASNIVPQGANESIGRLPLVRCCTIADNALRCFPHAMASDRRVMCAAVDQSIVRAISNGPAR